MPQKQTESKQIDISSGVFQTLSQLDPLWTRVLKPVVVMLSIIAIIIGIAGFFAEDPLYASVMISISFSFFTSCKLMKQLPETFGIVWNRNIRNSRPSEGISTDKYDLKIDDRRNNESLKPEAFTTFMQKFSSRLSRPIQWFISVGFSLIGVISWRLIYLDTHGSFIDVEPYRTVCRNLGSLVKNIIEFSALVSELAIGILVGLIAWRIFTIGRYITLLNRDFILRPQLLHPDRVGGLKPLGDLGLLNAMIIAIPSINLAGWIIAAPIFYEKRYGDLYTDMLLLLLVVALASARKVLWLPFRGVHYVMVEARAKIIPLAEKSYENILNLSDQLLRQAAGDNLEDIEKTATRLSLLQKVYQDYQYLPVWPFRLRILILQQAIPILGFLIGFINVMFRLLDLLK